MKITRVLFVLFITLSLMSVVFLTAGCGEGEEGDDSGCGGGCCDKDKQEDKKTAETEETTKPAEVAAKPPAEPTPPAT
ncbi:hypothetical protein ACFL6I_24310 [candidate division KSB1 bacterium]